MSDGSPTRSTRSPEEIRDDIERTREQLGDTAAALAEKTDVKRRAHEKADEVRQRVDEKKEAVRATPPGSILQRHPAAAAALGAFAGGFLLGRLTR